MITICQRCGLGMPGDRQHATYDECFIAMKERLGRLAKVLSFGASKIAFCRVKKHQGQQVIAKLDVCRDCLGAGYGAYQVAREMSLSGRETAVEK